MCLPLGCLKCIVEFEAWIILLGGIGLFIYTIVLQIQYNIYLNGTNDDKDLIWGQGLLTFFWILSSCVIVNGIFGVLGGKKKSAFLLFIFNLVNIGLFVAFLVIMILGYKWAGEMGNYNPETVCSDKDPQLNQVQLWGESLICSSECQCYYTQSTPLPGTNQNFSSTDSSLVFLQHIQATQVQNCPAFKSTTNSTYTFYSQILGQIEKNNQCGGWCQSYNWMIFYDINGQNKNVSETCLDIVQGNLQSMGMLMGDIGAGLTGFIGLMILFTFCLCFHPTQKDTEYYKRLAYYDEV